MVDKTITARELLELAKDGAGIKTQQRPMVIERLEDLIDKLDAIAKANKERAAADLARSQTQLEVLATLQALIRQNTGVKMSPPIDLTPLKTVLTEIQEATAHRPRVAYDFDIERNGQGYLSSIRATPVQPTLN